MENKKINLFLDSGAFSAWTQKTTIDIQEYILFIKKHEKVITIYANLDVIGDAEATWKNQQIMEKAGLSPVPVYHMREPISYLEKYLKYPYIALGGLVKAGNQLLIPWLDQIWQDYLTDEKGVPKTKVHGFGLTSLVLMLRYPWYSVDSTSWVVTGRVGSIYVPKFKAGKWIYDENSWKIAVSGKSPSQEEAGQHFTTLAKAEQKIILRYLEEKGYCLGKSEYKKESQTYELKENERWNEKKPTDKSASREVEIIVEPGVSNKYQLRDEVNITYFLDLEKSMPEWPWAFKTTDKLNPLF